MGAATGRAYWGAFRLWREVYEPTEQLEPPEVQDHKGVDRVRRLVLPAGNSALGLQVRCVLPPNPSSRTTRGLVALLREQRDQLQELLLRADPVVWVEDDTTLHTVASWAASTVTSVGHPMVDGDLVLIRAAAGGAGEWLLGTVSGATANTYAVASVDPLGEHTPVAGSQALRAEAYWRGMCLASMPPPVLEAQGGWYAREVVYQFKGSGSGSYARTAATAVGS